MPATGQDIKDFFALSGNNAAVTNGQLVRVQTWMNSIGVANSDGDDLVDHLYEYLKESVLHSEDSRAQDELAKASF